MPNRRRSDAGKLDRGASEQLHARPSAYSLHPSSDGRSASRRYDRSGLYAKRGRQRARIICAATLLDAGGPDADLLGEQFVERLASSSELSNDVLGQSVVHGVVRVGGQSFRAMPVSSKTSRTLSVSWRSISTR